MESILLPSKISFEIGEKANAATLVVEPCFQGYGTTVGNALRRVLLSSLTGAAVTAVKIKGVQHEFQAVPGVLEDALQVILNLKQLRLKVHSDEPVRLTLSKKGAGDVTAADFEKDAQVEIVNTDLKIATITDKAATLEMEIFVQRGRGFSSIEDRTAKTKSELGVIQIDALFSPVRNVGFSVQNARVGEITNYDKLVMEIETDGTMAPEQAVKEAAKILIDHFALLQGAPGEEGAVAASEEEKPKRKKKSEE